MRSKAGSILCTLIALALVGCGDGKRSDRAPSKRTQSAQVLRVALATHPDSVDPLTAGTPDGLEFARQIHEPLSAPVRLPRQGRRLMGIAYDWQRSRSGRVWLAHIRSGIEFQDGTALSAQAVVVNARRWMTTAVGRSLVPGLRRATAPNSTLVRFAFDRPVGGLPATLASPRLGLVSPRALRPRNGRGSRLMRQRYTGSGAFRLARGLSRRPMVLVGNEHWWALRRGVRPSIGRVVISAVADEVARVQALGNYHVDIAADLTAVGIEQLTGNPNIQVLGQPPGRVFATVRWLRGLRLSTSGAESFAGIWITRTSQPTTG